MDSILQSLWGISFVVQKTYKKYMAVYVFKKYKAADSRAIFHMGKRRHHMSGEVT